MIYPFEQDDDGVFWTVLRRVDGNLIKIKLVDLMAMAQENEIAQLNRKPIKPIIAGEK